MNYYDAMQIKQRAANGQPVDRAKLAEAIEFVDRTRAQHRATSETSHASPAPAPTAAPRARPLLHNVAQFTPAMVKPPMDVLCVCGARYGMHRVNDYACPNKFWRPGNGQEQWMSTQAFVRATTAPPVSQVPDAGGVVHTLAPWAIKKDSTNAADAASTS